MPHCSYPYIFFFLSCQKKRKRKRKKKKLLFNFILFATLQSLCSTSKGTALCVCARGCLGVFILFKDRNLKLFCINLQCWTIRWVSEPLGGDFPAFLMPSDHGWKIYLSLWTKRAVPQCLLSFVHPAGLLNQRRAALGKEFGTFPAVSKRTCAHCQALF